MIPSKHDRPDGWLQRIFLEAIARVRLLASLEKAGHPQTIPRKLLRVDDRALQ